MPAKKDIKDETTSVLIQLNSVDFGQQESTTTYTRQFTSHADLIKIIRERIKHINATPNSYLAHFITYQPDTTPIYWNKKDFKRGFINSTKHRVQFVDCVQLQQPLVIHYIIVTSNDQIQSRHETFYYHLSADIPPADVLLHVAQMQPLKSTSIDTTPFDYIFNASRQHKNRDDINQYLEKVNYLTLFQYQFQLLTLHALLNSDFKHISKSAIKINAQLIHNEITNKMQNINVFLHIKQAKQAKTMKNIKMAIDAAVKEYNAYMVQLATSVVQFIEAL